MLGRHESGHHGPEARRRPPGGRAGLRVPDRPTRKCRCGGLSGVSNSPACRGGPPAGVEHDQREIRSPRCDLGAGADHRVTDQPERPTRPRHAQAHAASRFSRRNPKHGQTTSHPPGKARQTRRLVVDDDRQAHLSLEATPDACPSQGQDPTRRRHLRSPVLSSAGQEGGPCDSSEFRLTCSLMVARKTGTDLLLETHLAHAHIAECGFSLTAPADGFETDPKRLSSISA